MEHPEADSKQSQIQRVLDRVRQLPIVPGITVDPETLRGIDFGQQLRNGPHESAISSGPRIAREQNGPAVRPLLLILTTAMSTIVVAMIATVVTLDAMRREPSPKVRPAGTEQTRVEHAPAIPLRDREGSNASIDESKQKAQRDVMAVAPGNGGVNAVPAPAPHIPATEMTSAQELPQSGPQDREQQLPQAMPGRERAVPLAEPQVRERENGKQRVPVASGQHKRERQAAMRQAVEQSERTHGAEPQLRPGAVGVGVGDVLSGGL